jgi:hypothetical protein
MTLRQMLCGLTGHDRIRHFERTKLSLKCTNCGHETPGWDGLGHHAPERRESEPTGSFTRRAVA